MRRMVIDTDPGVDDAHALMMSLAHPGAQVETITTVAGNVSLAQTTSNACIILDIMQKDVPVCAGCSRPLLERVPNATFFHGHDGLGNSGYLPSERRVSTLHAVDALVRLANESPGELVLVMIGPLTNLALATRLDPTLPTKYERLVVMGGAVRGKGNVTPIAEFNVHSDPEAAAIVFDAWPGLTLISWETTLDHGFCADQVETLMSMDSPRAEFFRRISRHTMGVTRGMFGRAEMLAPDALAVAVALEPDIVRRAEAHHVQVELSGRYTRGQTVVDWMDRTGQEPNVNLVLEMDTDRLWELMQAAVR
jgi:purine nucleosidase